MPVPAFSWQEEDCNTKRARKRPLTYHLFAGEMHLATLRPSSTSVRYIPDIYLPDVRRIPYYDIVRAKAAVERACTLWFEACFR